MDIFELFKAWGVAGVIAAATVWLIKNIFDQILKKDIDKFKHDLEKESIEFKIRYEKLHYERAEVVKEVYKKIVRTYKKFHSLMRPMQWADELTGEEKIKQAIDEINSLVDYYEENRIFFEESIAEEIDNLLDELRKCWIDFNYHKRLDGRRDQELKVWEDVWKKIDKDIPRIKKIIEGKFRDIIGIDSEK